jgi:hypothetical protein
MIPAGKSDHASHKQTDKPWKGNPEKEQRNDDAKIDLEKWHETKLKRIDVGRPPGRRLNGISSISDCVSRRRMGHIARRRGQTYALTGWPRRLQTL